METKRSGLESTFGFSLYIKTQVALNGSLDQYSTGLLATKMTQ